MLFKALADGSRRDLLALLLEGAQPVGALVAKSGLSQPLVSQHLRVLLTANLVSVRPEGQARIYSLNHQGFLTMQQWLERYEGFWSDRMDSLESFLNES